MAARPADTASLVPERDSPPVFCRSLHAESPAPGRHRPQRRGQIDLHHRRADAARVPAQSRQRRRHGDVGDAMRRPRATAATTTPSPAASACRRRRTAACSGSSNIRRTRSASRRSPPSAPGRTTAPAGCRPPTRARARHLGFHKTSSVDYAIVLSGEIYRADGRRRGPAQDRRRAGPARHQPRLEQPHRRAVLRRLRSDRRRSCLTNQSENIRWEESQCP